MAHELDEMMAEWMAPEPPKLQNPQTQPKQTSTTSNFSSHMSSSFSFSSSSSTQTTQTTNPLQKHSPVIEPISGNPITSSVISSTSKLDELEAVFSELDQMEQNRSSATEQQQQQASGGVKRSSSAPFKSQTEGRKRSSSFAECPESEKISDPAQEEFLRTWGRNSQPLLSPSAPVSQSRPTKVRCNPCCVGGSDAKPGVTTSSDHLAPCSALRCTKCDMNIMCFPDSVWTSTTDYLFLRNSFPDGTKLKQKLQRRQGFAARCCQCSWITSRNVEPVNTDVVRWVCSGHSMK